MLKGVPGRTLAQAVAESCQEFESIESAEFDGLLARIGDAKIVLLGEATHGASEFYRMRDRIHPRMIKLSSVNRLILPLPSTAIAARDNRTHTR
jgi:hypothetical protein